MKKISKGMDVSQLLKRNPKTTSLSQSQGKGSSDIEEPKQKKSKTWKVLGDLECTVCAQEFTQIQVLNRHIKTLHTAVEGGVKCNKDFCDLVFGTKHELNVHNDKCIFTCPGCSFTISRNGRAAGHKKKCVAFQGISDI